MKKNNRSVGGYYEQKAAAYLEQQGLLILECNYRCRMGELDLIARDGDYLVFVEVKYRKREASGTALAAVGRSKQQIICKMAKYYLASHYFSVDVFCRFDVVGIDGDTIHWIKNAFECR